MISGTLSGKRGVDLVVTTYATDFSEYSLGSPPTGWTERWNTTQFQENIITGEGDGRQLFFDMTSANYKCAYTWDSVGSPLNVDVLAKIKWKSGGNYNIGIGVRLTGAAGAEYGYVLWMDDSNNKAALREYVNGTGTEITSFSITLTTDTYYWQRVRIVRGLILCKIWADGGSEPTDWGIIQGGVGATTAGPVGLVDYTADGWCDYFSAETLADNLDLPTPLTSHSTDFTEYDLASPPGDWTERWDTGYFAMNIVAGTYTTKRLQVDLSAVSHHVAATWDDIGTTRNGEALARVFMATKLDNAIGVACRVSGAVGAQNGYFVTLYLAANTVLLRKFRNSGTGTTLDTQNFVSTINTYYWIRFRFVETTFQVRVWRDGEAEPGTWLIEIDDYGNIVSGAVGIYDYAADGWCDQFSYDDLDGSRLANSADLYVDTVNGDSGNDGSDWAHALDSLYNAILRLPFAADDHCVIHCKGADATPAIVCNFGFSQSYTLTIKADAGDAYSIAASVSANGVIRANAPWLTIQNLEAENTIDPPDEYSSGIRVIGIDAGDEHSVVKILDCILNGGRSGIRVDGGRNALIRNCVAYGTVAGIFAEENCYAAGDYMTTWIENSILVGGQYGIMQNNNSAVLSYRNCYLYGATQAYIRAGDLSNYRAASNDTDRLYIDDDLEGIDFDSSNFTDPVNNDFTLPVGSALINVGAVLSEPFARVYAEVSSVVAYEQNLSVGMILELTNGSSIAKLHVRDFGNAVYREVREFSLKYAFSGSSTKIALISDLHIGHSTPSGATNFATAIADLDAIGGISAALVLGDITDGHLDAQFDAYVTAKGTSGIATWKELAGNHDYGGNFLSKLGYTYLYHSYTVGNMVFIFLGDETGTAGISANGLTFLGNTLGANQDKNICILTHQPRFNTVFYSVSRDGAQPENYLTPVASIDSAVNSQEWQLWACGHQHGFTGRGIHQKGSPFCILEVGTEAKDILGEDRDAQWDVGPYEFQGAPVTFWPVIMRLLDQQRA
jgi:hypothetical protein